FADRPDDQGLATPHVAARENAVATGVIIAHRRLNISLRRQRYSRAFERALAAGTEEAHRKQDKLGLDFELGAGDRADLLAAVGAVDELGTRALERCNLAVLAPERLGQHRELALRAFLVRRGGAQLHRPIGPGER